MKLLLRPLVAGDAEAVFELLSDQRVIRYMQFPVFTREHAEVFVNRVGSVPVKGESGDVVFGCADSATQAVVGLCGVVVDAPERSGELWYLLRPDGWGQGLMTHTVASLVTHGFDVLELERLWATCLPQNPGSMRVLEKLGFEHHATRQTRVNIRGVWQDARYYERSRLGA